MSGPSLTAIKVRQEDAADKGMLYRLLDRLSDYINKIVLRVDKIEQAPPPPTYRQIRDQLGVTGSVPLSIRGLSGVASEAQWGKAKILSSDPTPFELQAYAVGQLVIVSAGGVDTLKRVIDGSPKKLAAVSLGAANNVVTTNTNQLTGLTGQKSWGATQNFEQNITLAKLIATYNGIATVDNGVPAVYGLFEQLISSVNIVVTGIYTAPAAPAKLYLVTVYLTTHTAGSAGSTVTLTIGWNDGIGAKTFAFVCDLTNATSTTGNAMIVKLAAAQSVQVSSSGTYNGAAKYDATVMVVAI